MALARADGSAQLFYSMSAQIRSECNDTDGSSAGLHVRRAVTEFIGDPDACSRQADVVVAMSPQTWAKSFSAQRICRS